MPTLFNEIFVKAPQPTLSLGNSYQKCQQPLRKTNTGKNALSFIGPTLWNKVPKQINLDAFKQNLKTHFLKELCKSNFYKKLLLLISSV